MTRGTIRRSVSSASDRPSSIWRYFSTYIIEYFNKGQVSGEFPKQVLDPYVSKNVYFRHACGSLVRCSFVTSVLLEMIMNGDSKYLLGTIQE